MAVLLNISWDRANFHDCYIFALRLWKRVFFVFQVSYKRLDTWLSYSRNFFSLIHALVYWVFPLCFLYPHHLFPRSSVQWATKVITPVSIRNTWKQRSWLFWPAVHFLAAVALFSPFTILSFRLVILSSSHLTFVINYLFLSNAAMNMEYVLFYFLSVHDCCNSKYSVHIFSLYNNVI